MRQLRFEGEKLVESYLDLRMLLGLLGVSLPLVLPLLAGQLQPSISDFYATRSRDVLVGVLFVIGGFLLAYRGYEAIDDVAGNVGGFAALFVALFPSTSSSAAVQTIHFVAAATLFLTFAFFCWFLFTKRDPKHTIITPRKVLRDRIYRISALLIVLGMAAVGVHALAHPNPNSHFVYYAETEMLWAFGFAWGVKGRALLADP